jgi:DNA-binding NarL/FixJ family response regulator
MSTSDSEPIRDAMPAPEFEPDDEAALTQREVDVLELLRGGRSNAEIAATLHVGFETVRTDTSSIYRKLGVSSRRELRSGEAVLAAHGHHGAP